MRTESEVMRNFIFRSRIPVNKIRKSGKLILVIEYFYIDFVDACKKVLETKFLKDKMNKPLLKTSLK